MGYIQPFDRNQLTLPESLDSYISCENPVRLIDVFVDQFIKLHPDFSSYKGNSPTGRSAYSFGTLLKLYVYGYLNSISSSRKLERETLRNMELIWLLGNLHPDHKTIADFRSKQTSGIHECCLDFRRFLVSSGYISGKLVACLLYTSRGFQTDKTVRVHFHFDGISHSNDSQLSLKPGTDGRLTVCSHGILDPEKMQKQFFGYDITDSDKQVLRQTGNMGHPATVTNRAGEQVEALVSRNLKTKELVAFPLSKVNIPAEKNGHTFTPDEIARLKQGEAVVCRFLSRAKEVV